MDSLILDGILLLLVIILDFKNRSLKRWTQTVLAESKRVPVSEAQIKVWKDALSALPAGTAKIGDYKRNIRAAEDELENIRKERGYVTTVARTEAALKDLREEMAQAKWRT